MKITYKNFWQGFEQEKRVFEMLFDSDLFFDISSITIQSVFKSRFSKLLSAHRANLKVRVQRRLKLTGLKSDKARKKVIWYTGENVRPPISEDIKLYLSFDQDNFSGKNVYLPLFYLRLLFQTDFARKNLGKDFELDKLVLPRKSDLGSRPNFACAFINNAEPTRLRAVNELARLGQVDVFGKITNRIVRNKFDVAKSYKFIICFENGIYPGYVTEKLLDAYVCGAIPIYWGDLGKNSILNPKAFINYNDFESLEKMTNFINGMSEEELLSMAEEPLLLRKPDIHSLRRNIHHALKTF